MARKTYYYHADKSDDFGNIGHNPKPLKNNYKYLHTNIFFRFFSFVLYYFLAVPILFVVSKIVLGVKVKNKKQMKKKLKKHEGYFFYSNHTHYFDAFLSHVFAAFPRRNYVLSHADPTNIPVVKTLIALLGCLPLPNNVGNYKNFMRAMKTLTNQGRVISIYPEGTVWPFYNDLRPMPKAAFKYPAISNKPIVLCAETWRQRKIFKSLKPRLTLTFSEPIRPDSTKTIEENADMFYNEAMKFFNEHVRTENNFAYNIFKPIE